VVATFDQSQSPCVVHDPVTVGENEGLIGPASASKRQCGPQGGILPTSKRLPITRPPLRSTSAGPSQRPSSSLSLHGGWGTDQETDQVQTWYASQTFYRELGEPLRLAFDAAFNRFMRLDWRGCDHARCASVPGPGLFCLESDWLPKSVCHGSLAWPLVKRAVGEASAKLGWISRPQRVRSSKSCARLAAARSAARALRPAACPDRLGAELHPS